MLSDDLICLIFCARASVYPSAHEWSMHGFGRSLPACMVRRTDCLCYIGQLAQANVCVQDIQAVCTHWHTKVLTQPHTATPKRWWKLFLLLSQSLQQNQGQTQQPRVCWISCDCSIFTDTDKQPELNIFDLNWFVRLCQCILYQKCPYMAVLSCATIEVENVSLAGLKRVQFNCIF